MITSRRALRVWVAVVASLGVHFAAAMAVAPSDPPALIQGGTTAEIAALGSGFEDLLQGSDRLQPAETSTVEPSPPSAEMTEPSLSEPIEATRPLTVASVRPVPIQAPPPVRETLAPATEAQAAPAVTTTPAADMPFVETARPDPAKPALAPAAPEPAQPRLEPLQASPVRPAETAPPSQSTEIAALAPAQITETVEAEPEERPVPIPVARPPRPEDARNLAETKARDVKKKAPPKKQVAKKAVVQSARGNASRDARAGNASGRTTQKAKTGGSQKDGKARTAGNANASNYPGKVYSKIRRTRQQRAGGAGVARVRFSISSSGRLSSIRLAASSGSAAIDKVALDHVRRSAPFPPPPAGAQRSFVIPIEVRR